MPYSAPRYYAPRYFAPRYFAGNGSNNPDLVAAVVAELRNSSDFVAAVGEASNTPKVATDASVSRPDLPCVVLTEVGESSNFESGDDVCDFALGMMDLSVFAPGKKQARDIRRLAVAALIDATIVFDDGEAIEFRPNNMRSPVEVSAGVGVPAVYQAMVTFLYRVRRTY